MFNRGTKYLEKGNYRKALSCFRKQEKEDGFKELYLNMGNCYKLLGNANAAMDAYIKAADDSVPFLAGGNGLYSLAYNNIGLMEYSAGDDSLAMEFYRGALTIDPLYGEAIWNYGNACLRSSNCRSGWEYYEYRFNRGAGSVRIDNSVPRWDGVSSGDSIVVQTEQGLGDKIMFGRYLSYLEKYFTRVVVCCHSSLDCLYPYETVRSCTGFDVSIPICSLAGIFGIVPENWLDGRFEPRSLDGEFKIGVCWDGSATHANNRNRSCNSSHFSSLSDLGTLYSISPDPKPAKNVVAIKSGSWEETASTLLGLDLVVSVDTSIVHLAGTLGVPCIMVQPLVETDFRWGGPGDTNVWYDSVTVVPNNNNWEKAFADVRSRILKIKASNV